MPVYAALPESKDSVGFVHKAEQSPLAGRRGESIDLNAVSPVKTA